MKINLGYRAKLLLAISAISIVMLTIMTVSRLFLMEDVLDERTLTRMETIGNILRNDIQQNLLDGEVKSMQNTVTVTASQRHIQFVSVVGKDNSLIFTSPESQLIGKSNPFKDSSDIKKEKTVFIKSYAMKHKDKNLGSIQIGFSLETLNNDLKTTVRRTVAMNLISLVLILAVSWFIAGKLLEPIVRMKAISEKIAKGNFSERLPVTSRDVIGELEVALNNMAGQLSDLTANLNKKIEEATRQLVIKTRELEDSNQRLKELDKLKSEFVSVVSHELRTPLTGIIGFAKTLLKVKVSDEQRGNYLRIIESEGKRLSTLIEEFLDISRIESGNIELQLQECNLVRVIEETVTGLVVPRDVAIETIAPNGPLIVQADTNKVKQVIANILNNAVRYTQPGQKITISAEDRGNEILISIKDRGPGITKEDKDKVFDKFYRGKDDVSNKSRGSGLGLAIAKGIMDMHKGRIWVESEPGQGSNFKFTFPKEV
ncbi:MAG: hypothetical protein A2293_09390 [Elusimicrobia bacterium RIFOXYB2_FULL_49_7]|nr:MAG: hypothetical protein A2293_09390 [Elusimicrobia bacterium RIFOXYB2_FULL_49_7]